MQSSEPFQPRVFHLSPLIRITLLLFYVSLTVPLPFLAAVTHAAVPPMVLAIGLILGGLALYAALCERVIVDEQGVQVAYPAWVPQLFRKGWSLPWAEVKALKPRSTGQGGIVYYFLSTSEQAYLLPMRIAGFAQFVRQVQVKTGIDTTDVRPLAQPWMYLFLLVLTVFLLAIDSWTVWTALDWTGLG
ncbi:MAG: hypothetical protein KME11_18450 [Timaviella obliquedivisa GSE-PSE-MK23-08B]|nr:hypothetical protein [Timaviella obliquedivisa GSE-PSE-MK23-08B]